MLISSSKTSLKPSPELRRSSLPSINYGKKEHKYNNVHKETRKNTLQLGMLVYDQGTTVFPETGKCFGNCEFQNSKSLNTVCMFVITCKTTWHVCKDLSGC